MEIVICIVLCTFHISSITGNLLQFSEMVMFCLIQVFSLSFGMTNPNPSAFPGKVQWKLAKPLKKVISTFFILQLLL